MRFDVYGRFALDVRREGGRWVVYYVGEGKRRLAADVVVPAESRESEIAGHIEALFHEFARPGTVVRPTGLKDAAGGTGRRATEEVMDA